MENWKAPELTIASNVTRDIMPHKLDTSTTTTTTTTATVADTNQMIASGQIESKGQLRCYLCEIPKKEFSIVRNFSEIVCRGCLNFEGKEKVEQLISEARNLKMSQLGQYDCLECYKAPQTVEMIARRNPQGTKLPQVQQSNDTVVVPQLQAVNKLTPEKRKQRVEVGQIRAAESTGSPEKRAKLSPMRLPEDSQSSQVNGWRANESKTIEKQPSPQSSLSPSQQIASANFGLAQKSAKHQAKKHSDLFQATKLQAPAAQQIENFNALISEQSQSPMSSDMQQTSYLRNSHHPASSYAYLAGFPASSPLVMRQLNPCGTSSVFSLGPLDRPDVSAFEAAAMSNRLAMNQRHLAAMEATEKTHIDSGSIYGSSVSDMTETPSHVTGHRINHPSTNGQWVKRANHHHFYAPPGTHLGQGKADGPYRAGGPMPLSSLHAFLPHHLRTVNVQSAYNLPSLTTSSQFMHQPIHHQSNQMSYHPQSLLASQFRAQNSQFSPGFHSNSNHSPITEVSKALQAHPSTACRVPIVSQRLTEATISSNQQSVQSAPKMSPGFESHTNIPLSQRMARSVADSARDTSINGLMRLAAEADLDRCQSPDILPISDNQAGNDQSGRPTSESPNILRSTSSGDELTRRDKSGPVSAKTLRLPRVSPISPALRGSEPSSAMKDQDLQSNQVQTQSATITAVNKRTQRPTNTDRPNGLKLASESQDELIKAKKAKQMRDIETLGGLQVREGSHETLGKIEASNGKARLPFTPDRQAQLDRVKCLSCGQPLADQDFVQCPSMDLHKFCFPCSRASIQQQQAENLRGKEGETKGKSQGSLYSLLTQNTEATLTECESVFCPSGKKCSLATEAMSWTFMVSKETSINSA